PCPNNGPPPCCRRGYPDSPRTRSSPGRSSRSSSKRSAETGSPSTARSTPRASAPWAPRYPTASIRRPLPSRCRCRHSASAIKSNALPELSTRPPQPPASYWLTPGPISSVRAVALFDLDQVDDEDQRFVRGNRRRRTSFSVGEVRRDDQFAAT